MKIDIQSHGFSMTDSIQAHISERVHYALSSRFDQIKKIAIRVSDINGPRKGVDKRCQVRISLPRLKDVVIEDIQSDLYVAISRAIDRASRTVNRRLTRLQAKKQRLFVPRKPKMEIRLDGRYAYI